MADAKISALTATSAALLTHEFPANEGGANRKVTADQLLALDGTYSAAFGAFSGTLSPTAATDTYVTGSRCLVPAATGRGSLKVNTMYRAFIQATKTAAGTASAVFTVRYGTAGTTADTAIATVTAAAQTAAADTGIWELRLHFVTVGSGTTATARAMLNLARSSGAVGLGGSAVGAVGSGFSSQVASSGIGVSVNTGASAAWTISMVHSELVNLT